MKSYFAQTWKFITVAAFLGTSACSKISFSPAPGSDLANTNTTTRILPNGDINDTFLFNQNGAMAEVDVLIVDDNSGSMANKQVRLGSALSSFVGSLGSVDWQLGITTTDTSDGIYGIKGSLLPFTGTSTNILTKNIPGYEIAFANTVYRPETGSADERGLLALIQSMHKTNTDNAGFFRANADLAVIFLSDEDEDSLGGPAATTPQTVVNEFQNVFGNSKTLTAYGIIIQPGDTACYNAEFSHGAHYGTIVKSLTNLTGGTTGSICDLDYGPALSAIGNRVIGGVRTATLSQDPIPATVVITLTPVDATLTYTLTGRTILFNKPPAKGTLLSVKYTPL